jgi:hypothetical protein
VLELVLRATYRFFHKMSQVVQMQSTDAKPAAVACFMASSIVMPLAVFGELRGLRVVSVRCTCVVPRVCQKHVFLTKYPLNKISFLTIEEFRSHFVQ